MTLLIRLAAVLAALGTGIAHAGDALRREALSLFICHKVACRPLLQPQA
jgi:hypothetical protein